MKDNAVFSRLLNTKSEEIETLWRVTNEESDKAYER